MLDLTDRLIVVFGGGDVAARKVAGLLSAAANRIRVVSPHISDKIPPSVERILEPYAPSHLEGAGLVFAATDRPEVNAAIVRDARALRLLVNRADHSEDDAGDFSVPAVFREDELVIAVAAGGLPTLAAAIRDQLIGALNPRFARLAQVMKVLRPRIMELAPPHQRRPMMMDLATPEAMDILEQQGSAALWSWVRKRHPLFSSPGP